MNATVVKGVVRNGQVEVAGPMEFPDGTEVTIAEYRPVDSDDGPMSPEEITRVLAAMEMIEPLEIPPDVAADLDAWEKKVNDHGIANMEKGIEDVFR